MDTKPSNQLPTVQQPKGGNKSGDSGNKSVQDVLLELEKIVQEKASYLNECKMSLIKQQEVLIVAQDELFSAFQQLSSQKEKYLVNLIYENQKNLNKPTTVSRDDNLDSK